MRSEKSTIRAAFAAAVETYDEAAKIQRQIADRLLALSHIDSGKIVLDAGCGTGYGTNQLVKRHTVECIALDVAAEMTARAAKHATIKPLCGDIEALPLHSHCIDLYWSSLAWQWTNTEQAMREAARVLRPGGKLRVATLGKNTLTELRHAFLSVDDATHVRNFSPLECYLDWLNRAGFTSITLSSEAIILYVPDMPSLWNHLKGLGAHVIGTDRRRGLFGRNAWQQVQAYYEALRTAEGLPVTYDVIYISADKIA